MPSLGDVFVTLRLEGSAFERGVAAAQAQAATLNQSMQRAAAMTAPVSERLSDAGHAADTVGEKFELSTRVIARFSAIATQQLVPSLDGSRQAIEGAVAGISHLAGGYGTLAVVGAGAAVVLGGIVVRALGSASFSAEQATKDLENLGATLRRLDAEAASRDLAAGRLTQALRDQTGSRISGAQTLANIGATPGQSSEFEGRTLRDPRAIRLALEGLRARQALGPDFSEVAGLFGLADRNAQAARKSFDALSLAVDSFQKSAQAALIADPLQKLMVADIQQADALIKKLEELRDVEGIAPELINPRLDAVVAALNAKIGANVQAAAPGAASRLGLSDTSLIFGFRDLDAFKADIAVVSAKIGDLAKEGVRARDLFNEIADAQARADQSIAALKEKYKDTPAVFNKLVEAERKIGGGGLQRSLDADVRSLQKLQEGAASAETEFGNVAATIDTQLVPAASDTVLAFDAVDVRVITLTEHFREMHFSLQSVIGDLQVLNGGTIAPPGPGNFQ
jgi:hypothetical protein